MSRVLAPSALLSSPPPPPFLSFPRPPCLVQQENPICDPFYRGSIKSVEPPLSSPFGRLPPPVYPDWRSRALAISQERIAPGIVSTSSLAPPPGRLDQCATPYPPFLGYRNTLLRWCRVRSFFPFAPFLDLRRTRDWLFFELGGTCPLPKKIQS